MLYFSIIALIIVISDGVKYIPDLFIPVDVSVIVSVWISAVDAVSEVVADARPDATLDGVPDAGPDATSDGVPDAGPDATLDGVPDAGPDASHFLVQYFHHIQ